MASSLARAKNSRLPSAARGDKTNPGVKKNNTPSHQQRALALAKSMATGQRDKNKKLHEQALGAAGAQAGKAVGGALGSFVPGVGNTMGALIGQRFGRIAGENPKLVLAAMILAPLVSIVQLLMVLFLIMAPIFLLLSVLNIL